MTRSNKPTAPTRRFASDARSESQLAWLRGTSVLAIGGSPPSSSQIIRRAIALLTEHVENLIEAGRVDGLAGFHPQDAVAERAALTDHAIIVDAAPARQLVDARGRLRGWSEAIHANAMRSLCIPAEVCAHAA